MFRVYDCISKKWIKDNVYLTPDDKLFLIKRSSLGWTKLSELSQDRYVYHKSIDLQDKNGKEVFEGDIIKAQVDEEKEETGLVVYAQELSSYVILCFGNDNFYTLGSEVCEYIEIVGNVFEGNKEVVQDGKRTLQESKE